MSVVDSQDCTCLWHGPVITEVIDDSQPGCGSLRGGSLRGRYLRYVSKISGPLMDRIDIPIDVPAINYKELRGNSIPESSAAIRDRVLRAREVQLNRFAAAGERIFSNAQMGPRQIRTYLRALQRPRTYARARYATAGFERSRS